MVLRLLKRRGLGRSWIRRHPVLFTFTTCVAVICAAIITVIYTVSGTSSTTENDIYNSAGDKDGFVFVGYIHGTDLSARTITGSWVVGGCGIYRMRSVERYGLDNHGTSFGCGPPSRPIAVYIDNISQPVWTYDPAATPRSNELQPGLQVIPYQFQTFQTTLPTDFYAFGVNFNGIHYFELQYLYPFDEYHTTSTWFVLDPTSNSSTPQSFPVLRVAPIIAADNLDPISTNTPGSITLNDTLVDDACMMHLHMVHSPLSKGFAVALFFVNWGLTATVLYITVVALVSTDINIGESVLVLPVTVILIIPALRQLYVGSPPFGILLDAVGPFLQMLIVSICALILIVGVSLSRHPRGIGSPSGTHIREIEDQTRLADRPGEAGHLSRIAETLNSFDGGSSSNILGDAKKRGDIWIRTESHQRRMTSDF